MSDRASRAIELVKEHRDMHHPLPAEVLTLYNELVQAVKFTTMSGREALPEQVSYLQWMTQRLVDAFALKTGRPLGV